MISFLVLLVLVWQFYLGYNRGIILQGYYTFASVVSLVVASQYYQKLAEKITLWIPYSNPGEGVAVSFFKTVSIFDLDKVYYASIAFIICYSMTYLAFRLLGVLIHFAPVDYFDNIKTNSISGALAVLMTLIFFCMIFTALATIPMPSIQNRLNTSGMVKILVNYFPILSGFLKHLWVTSILK